MRVGVLGTGRMGAFRARALAEHPEVEEVFVGSHHPERARELATSIGGRGGTIDQVLGRRARRAGDLHRHRRTSGARGGRSGAGAADALREADLDRPRRHGGDDRGRPQSRRGAADRVHAPVRCRLSPARASSSPRAPPGPCTRCGCVLTTTSRPTSGTSRPAAGSSAICTSTTSTWRGG